MRFFTADMSAPLAVVFSSVLFGMMHFDPLQGLGTALVGMYLGFVVLRTRSIWPGVAGHMLNNLVCALFARFSPPHTDQAWSTGHPPWVIVMAAAATMAAVVALVRLTGSRK